MTLDTALCIVQLMVSFAYKLAKLLELVESNASQFGVNEEKGHVQLTPEFIYLCQTAGYIG